MNEIEKLNIEREDLDKRMADALRRKRNKEVRGWVDFLRSGEVLTPVAGWSTLADHIDKLMAEIADEVSLQDAYHGSGSEVDVDDAEPVHPDLHSEFHPGSRCPHCDSGDMLVYSESGNATTDPDRIECGNCKEVLWERDVADQPFTIDAAEFEKFDFTHPAGTPVSVFVSKDGGETEEIKLDGIDPSTATAAEINAALREKGLDASMVHAMTPLHMLEDAERRAVQAEERRDKAQKREAAWVDWFEKLRTLYDGVVHEMHALGGEDVSERVLWRALEDLYPWPSLEDERAEAAMDE